MTRTQAWAATAAAMVLTATGSAVGTWILLDWLAGTIALARYRRARRPGEWVWR